MMKSLLWIFAFCLLTGSCLAQTSPYSVVHNFSNLVDGARADNEIAIDSKGNRYSMSSVGGAYYTANKAKGIAWASGTVWKMATNGQVQVLHNFGGTAVNANGRIGLDGWGPGSFLGSGWITFDSAGNMYGTASGGGAFGSLEPTNPVGGTVWEITTAGLYKDLHDFGGQVINANGTLGSDGSEPTGGVVFDAEGNMFGTAGSGGPYGKMVSGALSGGMIWEITKDGVYKDLHDFGGTLTLPNGATIPDGEGPFGGLQIDVKGNLYGTTASGGPNNTKHATEPGDGILFEFTASGIYKDLHDFGGQILKANGTLGTDGVGPWSPVTFDSKGNMFGSALGLIWEITTDGVYKDLIDIGFYHDEGNGKYWQPDGKLLLDSSGNIFGTSIQGGIVTQFAPNGAGRLWMLSPDGTLTVLHEFGGTVTGPGGISQPDGFWAAAGVAFDLDGNLVGEVQQGGSNDIPDYGDGVLYKYVLPPKVVQVVSVSVAPSKVVGGTSSIGTVTLNGPAPVGGSVVTLSSNQKSAVTPATVTVVQGSSTATFTITTSPVASSTSATIKGTLGNSSASATLSVIPPGLVSLALAPTSVVGGFSSTGTLTLNGIAPSGGLTIFLTSSSSVATMPSTVTVASGSSTVTFTVSTSSVSSPTTASIVGTDGTNPQSANLTVNPIPLQSLWVSPMAVTGGTPSTGTVTLSTPAPAGGYVIALSSSSSSATVPASVTVAAGATTANFTVTTFAVTSQATGTINATLYSLTKSATLTINPATIQSISVFPISVTGGTSVTGTVTLSGPAPTGGISVSLSSNSTCAKVPASVTVAAGATATNFTVTTSSVSISTNVTLQGALGFFSQSTTLTVNPLALSSLSLSPSTVNQGATSTGTVTLSGPATASLAVSLSSSSASAIVPASVTIAVGATTTNFTVKTTAVSSQTDAVITGVAKGVTKSVILTITPATVASVSFNPNVVLGGSPSTGTVTLSGPAGPAGDIISLASDNSAAKVPASVTVKSGQTTATFAVSTGGVSTLQVVANISATFGNTQSATLTVVQSLLNTLTIAPTTVLGGTSSIGTVTIKQKAKSTDTIVTLSCDNPAAIVPGTLVFPAGANTAKFTITTTGVATQTVANISATLGITLTTKLTITPPTLSSLSLNPTSVKGGTNSTGTVTLSGPAPANGIAVKLSSNLSSATVPGTVTIPGGQKSVTFTITTRAITSQIRAVISAGFGASSKSASLTITP